MDKKIRVTIWNEFTHEKQDEYVKSIYPNGLHATIKEALDGNEDFDIRLAALDDPDNGLPDEVLNNTDVLLWWGHMRHQDVPDALVEKIVSRVYRDGMGFIALHSAHHSKVFRRLVGATGDLSWGDNTSEIVWNLLPQHPIAKGIPAKFLLEEEEMYGEPFMVPQPDELVFASWYKSGNIFRSGMTFYRGCGKIFYLQPGHESCRSFHNPLIQRIISNAIYWAYNPEPGYLDHECPYVKPVIDEFGIR